MNNETLQPGFHYKKAI